MVPQVHHPPACPGMPCASQYHACRTPVSPADRTCRHRDHCSCLKADHDTSTITVTTGQGQPTRPPIIPGRELAAITMSQAATAPTTGTAHQDAQAARGAITFYNAAPVEQTVNAGTLLTGADGIQIVTEQDAIIPAATPPTEGQATVSAHAVVTGPAGNIVARDVYGPCCRLNVFAVSGPFHGGENARSY